jgi:hypothetical protein
MDRTQTSKTRRLGHLTKAAAAATLTATAALALGGTAHAVTYAGSGAGAYSSTSSGTMSDGTSAPAPPTQNLANLAHDMWTASKGVSAAAHFDRGMVSGGSSVAITVKWGSVAQTTGYYNNTYGSRFAFNFPAGDGTQRWEVVSATMTERTSAGRTYTYTTGRSTPVKALWDVSLGQLDFVLLSDCANFGDSNINLYFTYSGVQGQFSFSLGKNQAHDIPEFARSWSEVGVSNDLRVPNVNFYDEDFHFSGAWIEGPAALSDQRILPATAGSYSVSSVQSAANNSCQARISYGLQITLRTYNV